MKKRWPMLILLMLVVACVGAFIWKKSFSDWAFIKGVTGFQFPSDTQYLAQYDNAEWFIVSVVRVPEHAVSPFASQHKFRSGGRHDMAMVSSLPIEYRHIPDHRDLLSAAGRTEYQSWEAVLDPQSRLLWIQVTYPDWAGDHSGTAPQLPNHTLVPAPISITTAAGAPVAPSSGTANP
jgi:hypothetical protein